MLRLLTVLVVALSFAASSAGAIPGTPSANGPCDVVFEDSGTGTHGWLASERTDYAHFKPTLDCLSRTYDPPTSAIAGSIAWESGGGGAGATPDSTTQPCVEVRYCQARRIEANSGPIHDGVNCFLGEAHGAMTEPDLTPHAEPGPASGKMFCAS